jgi:hypothetical protein
VSNQRMAAGYRDSLSVKAAGRRIKKEAPMPKPGRGQVQGVASDTTGGRTAEFSDTGSLNQNPQPLEVMGSTEILSRIAL